MADTENRVLGGDQGDIVIYQGKDSGTKIDVRVVDETVWLCPYNVAN